MSEAECPQSKESESVTDEWVGEGVREAHQHDRGGKHWGGVSLRGLRDTDSGSSSVVRVGEHGWWIASANNIDTS